MPSDAPERDCAQCGKPFRHGNPTYKTCRSPRCVNQQRAATYKKSNEAARERNKKQAEEARHWSAKMRRVARPDLDEPRADEAARRNIIGMVQADINRGSFESHAVINVSERINEPAAVVLSVWRSRGER